MDDGRARVIVGIDVAGPGKDETTICVRAGNNIIAHKEWNERDAERAQGAVVAFVAPFKSRVQCINVDVTGIGHYFPVAFRKEGYVIQSVNFGAGPANKDKSWEVQCANRKAEMYWRTREVLNAGLIHGLDDEMISQAAQVRYFYDLQGRVAIEPKKTAAKRGLSSPDRWESVILAFGLDSYESLSQSLSFMQRVPRPMSQSLNPNGPRMTNIVSAREEFLRQEAMMDSGEGGKLFGPGRHTNPGIFSGRKGGF